MKPSRSVAACLLVGFVCAGLGGAPAPKGDSSETKPAEPKIVPGAETRFENAKYGGYFLVWAPKEYTPDHEWPVIFCYHGMGGDPTTWPFRDLTNNKNFIIIGMEYVKDGPGLSKASDKPMGSAEYDKFIDQEVENARMVTGIMGRQLRLDKNKFFIGGMSRGGWMASSTGESSASAWAGIIIIAAGRERRDKPLKNEAAIHGKPIYIGVGEKDVNNQAGRLGVAFYKQHGAQVTFEEYKGIGHDANPKSEVLRDWLLAMGPLKTARADFAQIVSTEKSGKLGQAYRMYQYMAGISDTDATCQAADKAAKALAEKAKQCLEEAKKKADDKQYAEAAKMLSKAKVSYEGTEFGESAAKDLGELRANPEVKAAVEQADIDADATALEARARMSEKNKDFAAAIKTYELYVAKFPQATRFAEVKKHLEEIKADKRIATSMRSDQADRDCKNWMSMAENYIKAGASDKAVPYLKKIIDAYGDTEWAAKARTRLAEIQK